MDIITKMLAKSDEELSKDMGLPQKLEELKTQLARADKLSGEERKTIINELEEMLAPRVSPNSLEWRINDAERIAHRKTKTPEAEMADCSPASVCED